MTEADGKVIKNLQGIEDPSVFDFYEVLKNPDKYEKYIPHEIKQFVEKGLEEVERDVLEGVSIVDILTSDKLPRGIFEETRKFFGGSDFAYVPLIWTWIAGRTRQVLEVADNQSILDRFYSADLSKIRVKNLPDKNVDGLTSLAGKIVPGRLTNFSLEDRNMVVYRMDGLPESPEKALELVNDPSLVEMLEKESDFEFNRNYKSLAQRIAKESRTHVISKYGTYPIEPADVAKQSLMVYCKGLRGEK
jgi:hypothetical protein